MKSAWFACLMFFSLAGAGFAQDITLPDPLKVDNVVYKGTLYEKHDAVYLSFMHSEGTARVPIADCPKDVQKLLGYDSQAADLQIQALQQQQAAAAAALAAATPPPTTVIHGTLVANTEKGLLVASEVESGKTREVTSSSFTMNSSSTVSQTVPIMKTVYYLVSGNTNAEYLKPGLSVAYQVTLGGQDFYQGQEATAATFVRNLKD